MILEDLEAAYRDASRDAGQKQVIVSMHLAEDQVKVLKPRAGSSQPEPVGVRSSPYRFEGARAVLGHPDAVHAPAGRVLAGAPDGSKHLKTY